MRELRGFSLEEELLLLLARGRLGVEDEDRARSLLGQKFSWSSLLGRALAEDVVPLLYRNLRRLGFPAVPPEVRTELEAVYRVNALRNTLLVRELTEVLQLLGAASVPVIPLKGVALAESLYGDPALRVCADLDILVPRQMAAQAMHLLLARGYSAEFSEAVFADLILPHSTDCGLVREEHGIHYLLEPHWGVVWRAPADGGATEDLWAEACPKAFYGIPAYTLSPEWELLFLAAHAAHHRCHGLKWLVDLHEICVRGKIDWAKLQCKAKRLGWEDIVRLPLHAAHTLFGSPIPAELVLSTRPRWLQLFPAEPAPAPWHDACFPLRLLKRPADKLRYLMRVLLMPTLAERRLLRLPSSLSLLYYPLRPLRLGCKWGWQLVQTAWQR
jgi:hypothetical protein